MTSRLISRGGIAVLLASLCAGTTAPMETQLRAQAPEVGTEAQRESGKNLYAKYCSQCHGEKGDGEGYATPHLYPRPRNFTTGKFKVRTTPNGALPTHQDLGQHRQARHAVHVDARLARPVGSGSVGYRLLHYDLLC